MMSWTGNLYILEEENTPTAFKVYKKINGSVKDHLHELNYPYLPVYRDIYNFRSRFINRRFQTVFFLQ